MQYKPPGELNALYFSMSPEFASAGRCDGRAGLTVFRSVPHISASLGLFLSVSLRLSPAAYYAQRMIQYLSRRDSIRQRSMRYQQNRLRSSTSSSSSDNQGPSVEGTDLEFEDFE